MSTEDLLKLFHYIKKHGKPPYQYFTISDYSKLHIYLDKEGKPEYKKEVKGKEPQLRTMSIARIGQRLDRGEIYMTKVENVFGAYIDAFKYPPKFSKRGAPIKKKKEVLQEEELEKFVAETVKHTKEKELTREEFKIYIKSRYELIKGQVEKEVFIKMIINYK